MATIPRVRMKVGENKFPLRLQLQDATNRPLELVPISATDWAVSVVITRRNSREILYSGPMDIDPDQILYRGWVQAVLENADVLRRPSEYDVEVTVIEPPNGRVKKFPKGKGLVWGVLEVLPSKTNIP